jgi:acylphosphatase
MLVNRPQAGRHAGSSLASTGESRNSSEPRIFLRRINPVTIGKHVIYSGDVQGVGFRMTAYRLAERSGVAGFVRNLADGSVELLAEGEPAQVERFLAGVRSVMGNCIHSVEVRDEPPTQRSGFQILH